MNEAIREGFVDAGSAPSTRRPKSVSSSPPREEAPPPPPREEPPAPSETWPVTVKLRRPIVGNKGEQISELTFREPTGRDINNCGNPVRIDSAGEIQVDEKKMTAMMGQLSGVLAPLLNAMHPVDWNSCYYRLRPFFLPDPTSW
jgi:hypothetical protein